MATPDSIDEALELGGPHKYHYAVLKVNKGKLVLDNTDEPPWNSLKSGLVRCCAEDDDFSGVAKELKPLLLSVRVFIQVVSNHELDATALTFLKWKIHTQGRDSVVVQNMLDNSASISWVDKLGGYSIDGWDTTYVNRYRDLIIKKLDLTPVSCDTIWTGVHQAWTFFIGFIRLIMPTESGAESDVFYQSWTKFAANRAKDSAPRLYIVVPQSCKCPTDGCDLTDLGLKNHGSTLRIKMTRAGEKDRPYDIPIEEVYSDKMYLVFIKFASVVQNIYDMTEISGSGIKKENLPWEVQAFYFTLRSLCHQNKYIRIIYYKDDRLPQVRFPDLIIDCVKEDIKNLYPTNLSG